MSAQDDNVNLTDIYDDFEEFDLGKAVEKLEKENRELKNCIESKDKDINKLADALEEMKKVKETLTQNISSLYRTSKLELDRKDKIISDLQTRVDNFSFRREGPYKNNIKKEMIVHNTSNLDENETKSIPTNNNSHNTTSNKHNYQENVQTSLPNTYKSKNNAFQQRFDRFSNKNYDKKPDSITIERNNSDRYNNQDGYNRSKNEVPGDISKFRIPKLSDKKDHFHNRLDKRRNEDDKHNLKRYNSKKDDDSYDRGRIRNDTCNRRSDESSSKKDEHSYDRRKIRNDSYNRRSEKGSQDKQIKPKKMLKLVDDIERKVAKGYSLSSQSIPKDKIETDTQQKSEEIVPRKVANGYSHPSESRIETVTQQKPEEHVPRKVAKHYSLPSESIPKEKTEADTQQKPEEIDRRKVAKGYLLPLESIPKEKIKTDREQKPEEIVPKRVSQTKNFFTNQLDNILDLLKNNINEKIKKSDDNENIQKVVCDDELKNDDLDPSQKMKDRKKSSSELNEEKSSEDIKNERKKKKKHNKKDKNKEKKKFEENSKSNCHIKEELLDFDEINLAHESEATLNSLKLKINSKLSSYEDNTVIKSKRKKRDMCSPEKIILDKLISDDETNMNKKQMSKQNLDNSKDKKKRKLKENDDPGDASSGKGKNNIEFPSETLFEENAKVKTNNSINSLSKQKRKSKEVIDIPVEDFKQNVEIESSIKHKKKMKSKEGTLSKNKPIKFEDKISNNMDIFVDDGFKIISEEEYSCDESNDTEKQDKSEKRASSKQLDTSFSCEENLLEEKSNNIKENLPVENKNNILNEENIRTEAIYNNNTLNSSFEKKIVIVSDILLQSAVPEEQTPVEEKLMKIFEGEVLLNSESNKLKTSKPKSVSKKDILLERYASEENQNKLRSEQKQKEAKKVMFKDLDDEEEKIKKQENLENRIGVLRMRNNSDDTLINPPKKRKIDITLTHTNESVEKTKDDCSSNKEIEDKLPKLIKLDNVNVLRRGRSRSKSIIEIDKSTEQINDIKEKITNIDKTENTTNDKEKASIIDLGIIEKNIEHQKNISTEQSLNISNTTGKEIPAVETKNTPLRNIAELPKPRKRITPIRVKETAVCTFKNILEMNKNFMMESSFNLTDEGEIPILQLEENHFNNMEDVTQKTFDKSIIKLLDCMNVSNLDCDISKLNEKVEDPVPQNSLTFENVINNDNVDVNLIKTPVKNQSQLLTSTPKVDKNKHEVSTVIVNNEITHSTNPFVKETPFNATNTSGSINNSSSSASFNIVNTSVNGPVRFMRRCRMTVRKR